jgi:hypothetical protein
LKYFLALLLASSAHAETLWSGNFEPSKDSWKSQFPSDAPWGSGNAGYSVQSLVKHSGGWAVKCTVSGGGGMRWPLRNVPNSTTLPDGYFSGWYFIPRKFNSSWFNAMQWKSAYYTGEVSYSSNPTDSINVWSDKLGMHLDAVNYLDGQGSYASANAHEIAYSNDVLPIGQWFQVEAFHKWSKQPDGELTVWLNGKQLWSAENIRTEETNARPYLPLPRQWSCNLYGEDFSPKQAVLYLDDLAVSTTPLH